MVYPLCMCKHQGERIGVVISVALLLYKKFGSFTENHFLTINPLSPIFEINLSGTKLRDFYNLFLDQYYYIFFIFFTQTHKGLQLIK